MGGTTSQDYSHLPPNPQIPIQHTYFYILHGRPDHCAFVAKALTHSTANITTKQAVFGPWLFGGYGRQLFAKIPHNSLLDQLPPDKYLLNFGPNYTPRRIEVASDLFDHKDLINTTTKSKTPLPAKIPFIAVGCPTPQSFSDCTSSSTNWECLRQPRYSFDPYNEAQALFKGCYSTPTPVGFLTNPDPDVDSPPVKWSRKDEKLLGHIYQPPHVAFNITPIIHYDGLNQIVEMGHVDKSPITPMGHLLLLDVMAPSGRICLHQFITETHQYLSKGCILPLLTYPVTVLTMSTAIYETFLDLGQGKLNQSEIETKLIEAGFTQITFIKAHCSPIFPLHDEFENDEFTENGLKLSTEYDGRFVGKRDKKGGHDLFSTRAHQLPRPPHPPQLRPLPHSPRRSRPRYRYYRPTPHPKDSLFAIG